MAQEITTTVSFYCSECGAELKAVPRAAEAYSGFGDASFGLKLDVAPHVCIGDNRGVTVQLGDELFSFSSLENWADTAQGKFHQAGVTADQVLCLDTKGRICHKGQEFMRAADEGAYPVRVFMKLRE